MFYVGTEGNSVGRLSVCEADVFINDKSLALSLSKIDAQIRKHWQYVLIEMEIKISMSTIYISCEYTSISLADNHLLKMKLF